MTSGTAGQSSFESDFGKPASFFSRPPQKAHAKSCVGIVQGARVVTSNGARDIQRLRIGDRIVARDNGMARLQRIERQSLVTRAVYVFAGTFGHYASRRDTLVPAGQPILIRDWRAQALAGRPEIIMPAETLIDGEYVRDIGFQTLTVYRLYCDTPCILYADGMEMASADEI